MLDCTADNDNTDNKDEASETGGMTWSLYKDRVSENVPVGCSNGTGEGM